MNLVSVILAAGKGTRMNSTLPKVLHQVCGKPMIWWVLDSAFKAGLTSHCVVVGHEGEMVQKEILASFPDTKIVFQKEQLGTGHAVLCAKESISDKNLDAVLILCGDTPLLEAQTLKNFMESFQKEKLDLCVLSTHIENPFGYGRIIRDEKNRFLRIQEHRDCNQEELRVNEINTGIYMVKLPLLFDLLKDVGCQNSQKEYYLTDIVPAALKKNFLVNASSFGESFEFLGVNTIAQLEECEALKNQSHTS